MAPITVQQLHAFYNLDRVVFMHLITELGRNPTQSLLVMALWLWLEKIGFPSIIPLLANLSNPLLNALADEAESCLHWLQVPNVHIPDTSGLPLTSIAMRMEISPQLFVQRRFTAIAGIKCVLNKICTRIFIDILQLKFGSTTSINHASFSARTHARAYASTSTNAYVGPSANTNTSLPFPVTPLAIPDFHQPLFGNMPSVSARASTTTRVSAGTSLGASTSRSLPYPVTPLVIPGFPHPLFGSFTIPTIHVEEMDLSDSRIWKNKESYDDVPDDDKTMFLTFSRGFPVTEEEVRYLFTRCYGDCIKVLNMGEMKEQVLFATMVLHKVEQLDMILNGKSIAKLRVNGKHIWARKYERRD